MVRLVPGLLATLLNVAFCLQLRDGYYRHVDTGDQAGFSLGTFTLNGWLLPIAAVALLGGAILLPSPAAKDRRPVGGWAVAVLLTACAAFFVHYGTTFALVVAGPWHSSRSAADWIPHVFAAVTVAFGANVLACALAPHSGNRGGRMARLLSALMVAISSFVAVQTVALLAEFFQSDFLPIYLPMVILPSFAWFASLLWGAWLLYRRPGSADVNCSPPAPPSAP